MALHPEETEWINLLREGGEDAFRLLIRKFKDQVFRTALGFLSNEDDAEDLAQEVFITVFERVKDFRGDSSLSTWIYRITVTKSLDRIKAGKRKKRFANVISLFGKEGRIAQNSIPEFQHPGVALEDRESVSMLMAAVARLPEKQRVAITLFYLEQMSYKEVAEIMETSEKAVESLLSRAKVALRGLLQDFRNNL